jgi:hypothetical protein
VTHWRARTIPHDVNQSKRADEREDWTIIGCVISMSAGIVAGIAILYLVCR